MVLNGSEELQREPEDQEESNQDTWHWWNTFRSTANFEKRLCLALELTADLPDSTAIDRWLGEPVRCLLLPTHLFMTNKKGFPVLSKPHQMVVRQFLRHKTQILITGAQRHDNYKHYQQYMDHLWQVSKVSPLFTFLSRMPISLDSRRATTRIRCSNSLKVTRTSFSSPSNP